MKVGEWEWEGTHEPAEPPQQLALKDGQVGN